MRRLHHGHFKVFAKRVKHARGRRLCSEKQIRPWFQETRHSSDGWSNGWLTLDCLLSDSWLISPHRRRWPSRNMLERPAVTPTLPHRDNWPVNMKPLIGGSVWCSYRGLHPHAGETHVPSCPSQYTWKSTIAGEHRRYNEIRSHYSKPICYNLGNTSINLITYGAWVRKC